MEITSYGKAKKMLEQDGANIRFVAPSILDEALCLIAVEHSNDALSKIPRSLRTDVVCLAAMKNGNYLGDVPFLNRTEDICREGVKNQSKASLVCVPEELLDVDICKDAVAANGYNIKDVPEKFITKEMCRAAVSKNPMSLEYVPVKFRTDEICQIAVDGNKNAAAFASPKFQEILKVSKKPKSGFLRFTK